MKCRTRVQGSTLIETIVSMTILLSIISTFFLTVTRINSSLNPEVYYKAHLLSCELLTPENLTEGESDFEMNGYKIIRKIVLREKGVVFEITVTIFLQNGHKVIENRKIISPRIEI